MRVRCRRSGMGQSATEFAIVVPVFLLFIFGIIQGALLLRANMALTQAASDAAHVVAAQSSTIPSNLANWQADAPALAAIRAALATHDLNGITEIDIASVNSNSTIVTMPLTSSVDLTSTLTSPIPDNVQLLNRYVYSPSGTGTCQVDQFNLINPLSATATVPSFLNCSLPWNGNEFDSKSNQNGRNDQRCTEDRIMVKIKYHYTDLMYPIHYDLMLVSQDYTLMEPRQFMGGSAAFQSTLNNC